GSMLLISMPPRSVAAPAFLVVSLSIYPPAGKLLALFYLTVMRHGVYHAQLSESDKAIFGYDGVS
ncbi:MAG: hypothetical protein ACI80M_001399, partial [Gammaproteobacteria bacterium]